MRHLIPYLYAIAIRHIDACGLRHILYMPKIRMNRGLLIALVERWHSDHNSFHFPTREISVTKEDVYKILHIPIIGISCSMIITRWVGLHHYREFVMMIRLMAQRFNGRTYRCIMIHSHQYQLVLLEVSFVRIGDHGGFQLDGFAFWSEQCCT